MSVCKGCGKEIVWGITPEGKRIPLDPRPPVYETWAKDSEETGAKRVAANYMVSHFATCSRANDFSGKNKGALK